MVVGPNNTKKVNYLRLTLHIAYIISNTRIYILPLDILNNPNEKAENPQCDNLKEAINSIEEAQKLSRRIEEAMEKINQEMGTTKRRINEEINKIRQHLQKEEIILLNNMEKAYLNTLETLNRNYTNIIDKREELKSTLTEEKIGEDKADKIRKALDGFENIVPDVQKALLYTCRMPSDLFSKTTGKIIKEIENLETVKMTSVHIPPRNLRVNKVCSFTTTLEWEKRYKDEEYKIIIAYASSPEAPIVEKGTKESIYSVVTLEPDIKYVFRVKAKSVNDEDTSWSVWSEPVEYTTTSGNIPGNIAEYCFNPDACKTGLGIMLELTEKGDMDSAIGVDLIEFIVTATTKHMQDAVICKCSMVLLFEVLKKYLGGTKNYPEGNDSVQEVVQANEGKIIIIISFNNIFSYMISYLPFHFLISYSFAYYSFKTKS